MLVLSMMMIMVVMVVVVVVGLGGFFGLDGGTISNVLIWTFAETHWGGGGGELVSSRLFPMRRAIIIIHVAVGH